MAEALAVRPAPANAISSETTRSRLGRSPSTGQARIEAQIGMV